jgi:Icc-related predicted phosphoesterase
VIVLGDVHGKWKEYYKLLDQFPDELSIQIGDMGVGFPGSPILNLKENQKWFRGNHDAPHISHAHPNHMGDYGGEIIENHRVFWVAGAWSIDWTMRQEGRTWWRDEELTYSELDKALEEYLEFKPEIMLSHDTPSSIGQMILDRHAMPGFKTPAIAPTRTGQALQAMFEAYQPKKWIFGHWHQTWTKLINGTEFQCLDELEWTRI